MILDLLSQNRSLRRENARLKRGLKLAAEVIRCSGDEKAQSISWEKWNAQLEAAVSLFRDFLEKEQKNARVQDQRS